MIIKPEIGKYAIPWLLSFSEAHAQSEIGLELDPIILPSTSDTSLATSSLYSTRYGLGNGGIYGDLITSDTRVISMHHFLVDYHSPMAPYAETFVVVADEVGLDWRLVAGISGVESGFGRIIPYNSYNAWGWRGGPGGNFSNFGSWEEAIDYITRRLAVGYGTELDVFGMESTYCPPCGLNPAHAWANGVSDYMGLLSQYRREL
ncbi:MAG: hypothetical protein U9Q67_04055 [Patescibacteria group bacterium]|nr:hypothetical protein [Patescibacteria group bacterium]